MRYLAIGMLVFLMGCGGVRYTHMVKQQYAPRPDNCQLDMYDHTDTIAKPYIIIGEVGSETGRTIFHRHSIQAAVEKLSVKACRIGADAVILVEMEKRAALSAFTTAGYGYSQAKATAIRYK